MVRIGPKGRPGVLSPRRAVGVLAVCQGAPGNLLPVGLTGAGVPPRAPVSFSFCVALAQANRGARFGKLLKSGAHLRGEGNDDAFHAAVIAPRPVVVMRHPGGNLTQVAR